ncbi:MAG: OsmC family protein [Burkholderiales bacterium]
MHARVKWIEGLQFLGETGSGHALLMDAAVEAGGANLGPRPMELLLIGAAGCSGIDVVNMLKKGHQNVKGCVVEIEAERAQQDPKVFTRIHFHYVVSGRSLRPDRVERAIRLSAEKYCSASIMLGKTATLTQDFELTDA